MIRKEKFYNLHADLCKAIFNPKRLEIIDALRNNTMNVKHLSNLLKTKQSNISQHLKILKSNGLVLSEHRGNNTYYSISNFKLLEAFDLVSEIIRDKIINDKKILNEIVRQ